MADKQVIYLVALADGRLNGHCRRWLCSADPDARDGRGVEVTTDDQSQALQFDNKGEAMEYWRRQSTVRPYRPDGKPNRPTTAYTVLIHPLGESPLL